MEGVHWEKSAPEAIEDRPQVNPGIRSRSARFGLVVAKSLAGAVAGFFLICTLLLISYNWVFPPTTGVHIQRRVQSLFVEGEYSKRYDPIPMENISRHLAHAVIAAEDTRFFEHGGFDWDAIEQAYEEGGRRGGSTISQQLAKNLFLTTHRSYLRKALEVPLTVLTELLLPKERILELYVNVVEWGPGVFGAESASRHYFNVEARQLTRSQSAALAACLPDPLRRRPRTGGWYTQIILRRMDAMGY